LEPKLDPLKYLNEVSEDIRVGVIVNKELGHLSRPVLGAIERWYEDVDIIIPISEMELDATSKVKMVSQCLEEMLEIFQAEILSVQAGKEYVKESHEELASKVDPLWRELAALHASIFNAEFQAIRPSDQEEMNERINVVEEITGMTRFEIKERATKDLQLRRMLCDMGLLPTDLN